MTRSEFNATSPPLPPRDNIGFLKRTIFSGISRVLSRLVNVASRADGERGRKTGRLNLALENIATFHVHDLWIRSNWITSFWQSIHLVVTFLHPRGIELVRACRGDRTASRGSLSLGRASSVPCPVTRLRDATTRGDVGFPLA